MSERQLYRLVAGKRTGPYAPEKLRPLMADGRISRLDRFSYDGVDWLPANQFPELMGKEAATVVAPVVIAELRSAPTATEGAVATPPKPVTVADSVTASDWKMPQFWVLGAVVAVLVVATGITLLWGSRALERAIDVTDDFAMLADSLEGYEGKHLLVRGLYFPAKLTKTSQSGECAITFRSESGCLLNGDCAYRLTLLASEKMAKSLRQVAKRLTNEQAAMVKFACSERRTGDRFRAYGLVDRITFCKQIPEDAGDKGFLTVDRDGTIREH